MTVGDAACRLVRVVDEELPDELKQKVADEETLGEANLRGHLKGESEDAEGQAGSLAFVPEDKQKDTQLKYALDLLRAPKAATH